VLGDTSPSTPSVEVTAFLLFISKNNKIVKRTKDKRLEEHKHLTLKDAPLAAPKKNLEKKRKKKLG
jgi:hypothetical protein